MSPRNLDDRAHKSPAQNGGSRAPEHELREALLQAKRGQRLPKQSASRIAQLVPKVQARKVAALALEARERMKLSHASLFLVREMSRHQTHRALVADTLARVIRQPEELIEFVGIYWKDGRVPLSKQVKQGLAAALPKFTERELAACKRRGPVRLRDVLFLSHAKPRDEAQAAVWKRLIWGRLNARADAARQVETLEYSHPDEL
jgi:hypothetical protein